MIPPAPAASPFEATALPSEGLHSELQTRIELCGDFVVQIRGRRCETTVPGPRGRLLLAHLVWNRRRSVTRDELIAALWPDTAPASPEGALSTLLTRLRRGLGDDVITGRSQLRFALDDAVVDVEEAAAAAAAASAATLPAEAVAVAREAIGVVGETFLPGIDVPWAAERRRELDSLLTRVLETLARAALTIGGDELIAAEDAGRRLIELEPYRESAYALSMEAAAARGNVANALLLFEELRVRLRDELGTSPGRPLVALHERLLRSDDAAGAVSRRLPAELAHAATRVVARTRELERLRARWRTAAAGTLQLVLLEGEPGVGKTALLSAIARETASMAVVLYGRAQHEAVVPHQPFVEAVRQAVRVGGVPSLPAPQSAELARFIPEMDSEPRLGGDDFDVRRYTLFEAVTAVIRDAAAATPVLLGLDDLQWADASTLQLLRHVVRGAGDSRLCVVASVRSGEATHPLLEDVVSELERRDAAERIPIGGLDSDGVAELVADRVEGDVDPDVVVALQRRTSGNPLFVQETLRALGRPDAPSLAAAIREGRVPDAVKALVRRRVADMGSAAAVLELAAVIGREFKLRVLEAVYAGREDVAAAVDDALRRELLREQLDDDDRLAFVHEVVREALYEHQTSTRRTRAHAAIAETLEREQAPLAEIAHHFFYGRHVLGADRAVAYSMRAAEHATAQLAHDDAAMYYERALRACETEAERRNLLFALAEALERSGDLYESRRRFREAADAARAAKATPDVFARAALGFAKYQEYGVVDTEAIELLEQALAGAVGDACRAELKALLAVRIDREQEQGRREALFDEALQLARKSGDAEALGAVLANAPFVLSQPERVHERLAAADEAIAIAAQLGQAEWKLSAHVTRFVALLTIGNVPAADDELVAYTALADEVRHPWSQWYARMLAATRALLGGDVARGRRLSEEAWERRRAHEPDADEVYVAQAVMAAVVARRPDQIDLDRVRAVADRFSARPGYRALYALAAVLTGETAAAVAEIDRYRTRLERVRHAPDALNALALLGEAAALTGDEEAASPLYAALVPFADLNVVMDRGWAAWGSASRQLALLARLTGDGEAAERYSVRAMQQNLALGAVQFASTLGLSGRRRSSQ